MAPNTAGAPVRHAQFGALQAVATQTISLARSLGRDDLADRLATVARRLERPTLQLLVAGEFKQGKSSLINALLGQHICPVDDDIATSTLTYISGADSRTASAHVIAADGSVRQEPFDPADAPAFITEAGESTETAGVVRVELGVPAPMLERLTIVDTPGVGGLESAHGAATIGALAEADAAIFVTDASQELTGPELDFVRRAHELCPHVLHVVTKTDLYPEWRRIRDDVEASLAVFGRSEPVMSVSSTLAEAGTRLGDEELALESGVPALRAALNSRVIAPGDVLLARAVLAETFAVAAQLAAPVEAERAVLADPAVAEERLASLRSAEVAAQELQGRSSGWQLTLSDGVADLNSDVDHDLRARTRRLIQESEVMIDAADPADMWSEFEAELYVRTTNEIVENFGLLTRRVGELVATVEDHFSQAERTLAAAFGVSAPVGAVEGLTLDGAIDLDRPGLVSQGMTGLRGSYGGVLMFTMIGNLAGLAVLNPAILVIGLVMGRKSLREEKKRQLNTRRQQAKTAVRKYVDEVSFQVGKDSRDSLRLTQRELRDHFTARAEELSRSMREALEAAQQAASADDQLARSRTVELDRVLNRLHSVHEQCQAIEQAITGQGAT